MGNLAPLFAIAVICITVYKIIELKYKGKQSKSAQQFQHELAQELADRDDKANALEERIRVLEKIVTDTHAANALSEEIEQLKKSNGAE